MHQTAATVAQQYRDCGAAHPDRRVEVELESGQPLIVGHVQEAGPGIQATDVIDQAVETVMPVQHELNDLPSRVALSDVSRHSAHCGAEIVAAVGLAGDAYDRRSFGGEQAHGRRADARGGAGDEEDLSSNVQVHSGISL